MVTIPPGNTFTSSSSTASYGTILGTTAVSRASGEAILGSYRKRIPVSMIGYALKALSEW